MRIINIVLFALGINLLPVAALAQSTDGALPPAGVCNAILAHSDEEVSTPAYDAPTGTWPATIRPTEQQCRARWNVRHRAQRVEVVNADCRGGSSLVCTAARTAPTPRRERPAPTPTRTHTPRGTPRLDALERWQGSVTELLADYLELISGLRENQDAATRAIEITREDIMSLARAQMALCPELVEGQLATAARRLDGETDGILAARRVGEVLRLNCVGARASMDRVAADVRHLTSEVRRITQTNGRARFIAGLGGYGYGIGDASGYGVGLTLGVEGPISQRFSILGRVTLARGDQSGVAFATYGAQIQALAQYRVSDGDGVALNAGLTTLIMGTVGETDPNRVTGATIFGIGPTLGAGARIGMFSIDGFGSLLFGAGTTERGMVSQSGQPVLDAQGNQRLEPVRSSGAGWQAGLNLTLHI